MIQQSLNEMYSKYLTGELQNAEFEGSIYSYLNYNQDKTCLCHWKREDYEDYISWFYPRLHKAIYTYKDTGASFEAFMSKFILISSKEYRKRITSNSITEYSAWSAQIPDLYAYENPPPYMAPQNTALQNAAEKNTLPVYSDKNTENAIAELIINNNGRKNTKRLLALILKCYHYISEDFAEIIASKIGIDNNELIEMIKKLRTIRQEKDDRIFFMKERLYSQHVRCLLYEKKLILYRDNEIVYNQLKTKQEKARQRLDKMRQRIKKAKKEASNIEVAEVIGISKGTVDSSLHKLKVQWEKLSQNASLN